MHLATVGMVLSGIAVQLYVISSAAPSPSGAGPKDKGKGKAKVPTDPDLDPRSHTRHGSTSQSGAAHDSGASTSAGPACERVEVRDAWLAAAIAAAGGDTGDMCKPQRAPRQRAPRQRAPRQRAPRQRAPRQRAPRRPDYDDMVSRLPEPNRLLRFRLQRVLNVPEDFCELGCTSVWMELYAKINVMLAHATYYDPSLSHQSQINAQRFTFRMGPYQAPQTSSSNSNRASRPESSVNRFSALLSRTSAAIFGRIPAPGLIDSFKATCENIDFWFLVILLAKRDYSVWVSDRNAVKDAAENSKTKLVPTMSAATVTTFTMCASYFALKKLLTELNFAMIGSCVCSVEIFITNVRADPSSAKWLGARPQAIAERFLVDNWQLLSGARSVLMSEAKELISTFDPQTCMGSTGAACTCESTDICSFGFLLTDTDMFSSLRQEFGGPLWNMIPPEVQYQLFPNMPPHLLSQMENVPADQWMQKFIDSNEVPSASAFLASAKECFTEARNEKDKGEKEKATSNGVATEAAQAHFQKAEELIQEAYNFIRLAEAASEHASIR